MTLSIIIPTNNRAEVLSFALRSIQNNVTTSNDYEVIVVDNGSTDHTKAICESYENSIPNFRYIYDAEPGLLTGRHVGIEKANGEVLCFLDDDVELNPNYINGVITLFKDPNVTIATGPCLPKYEQYPPDWLSYFWTNTQTGGKWCGYLSLLDFGNEAQTIDPNFVWGLNFVIRKATILDLKGFHPDIVRDAQQFQGDGETGLTLKAAENGLLANYHPDLLLYHYVNKERVTKAYFKKRAYFQGVSNSFTDLRKLHLNNIPLPSNEKSLRDKLHPYYRWIKNFVPRKKQVNIPEEISDLMDDLAKNELNGYQFHQDFFNKDSKVKAWVLKADYWDFKLPK